MSKGVRRVVTGLNAEGKSAVLFDDRKDQGILWHSPTLPADNSGTDDAGAIDFGFELFHSPGSSFLVAEMPPGDATTSFTHATDTLDYCVVLKGRIELVLEARTVELGAGDCIVDRGVMHAWRAVGDEPALLAVVLTPAHPVGKGATV